MLKGCEKFLQKNITHKITIASQACQIQRGVKKGYLLVQWMKKEKGRWGKVEMKCSVRAPVHDLMSNFLYCVSMNLGCSLNYSAFSLVQKLLIGYFRDVLIHQNSPLLMAVPMYGPTLFTVYSISIFVISLNPL